MQRGIAFIAGTIVILSLSACLPDFAKPADTAQITCKDNIGSHVSTEYVEVTLRYALP